MPFRAKPLALCALICVQAASALAASDEEEGEARPGAAPGWVRERAYAAAGVGFARCLSGVTFPSSGPMMTPKPFEFDIDWSRQARENRARLPYTDWATLNWGQGPAAVYTVFNLKYMRHADKWFDQYFAGIGGLKYLTPAEVAKIRANEADIRSNSVAFFLAFDPDRTRIVYYPGDVSFHGCESMADPWLPGTPEEIRSGRRSDHRLIQNGEGLLALLNGNFIKHDNFSLYRNDVCGFGGFGYDFQTMMSPERGMATAAIYDDGVLRIGTFKRLPHRERIRTFVQNKYMVLEGGAWGRDASPPHFARYDDFLARSYLFIHSDGWYGYLWTMNVPAQICAVLAKTMRIRDMMILDIHSPVSCQVSLPGRLTACRTAEEFKAHSFNFVPVFADQSAVMKGLVAVSRVIRKGVQFDYRREAFQLGQRCFFGVFQDCAPEADRMRAPRQLQANLGSPPTP